MTPWLADPDVTLYHGDALEVLRELPSGSVHMCCTSPPFYGLRDYGHEGQIGLEETPDEWVARLVDVFREVRRVLRDDGTLWVEIGDSYAQYDGQGNKGDPRENGMHGAFRVSDALRDTAEARGDRHSLPPGFKRKDLIGQPWLLAFALRADGWYLRSEIIWARPNPMPESVTDRPTKSHSTVFLLSKRPRYFYDADAIREAWTSGRDDMREKGVRTGLAYLQQGPGAYQNHPTLDGSPGERPRGPDGRRQTAVTGRDNSEQHRDGERWPNPSGANARSVWTIPTEPTQFAHFATWPRKLVARMIQAGTSEKGCCPECGAPWVRERIELRPEDRPLSSRNGIAHVPGNVPLKNGSMGESRFAAGGWSPSCECGVSAPTDDPQGAGGGATSPVPCTVLDPFAGSGTTMLVARQHGRRSIGIELNEQYLQIAADRLSQLSLLADGVA